MDWQTLIQLYAWGIAIYMIIVIAFYTVILFFSTLQVRKQYRLNRTEPYENYLDESFTRPVSVIVPAYNEEVGVVQSVRSLLTINYPQFEIIVVNDGSKDHTLALMLEKYEMVKVDKVVRKKLQTEEIRAIYQSKTLPNLYIIDKKNGGKADALNAGLNLSHYPYFCSIDGDSVLESDAFLKVMKPIIDSGEDVIASGGSVRIANGCDIRNGSLVKVGLSNAPIVVMQVIEYLRAFLMGRIGLSRHNLLLIISGAFGVFSKHWVLEAGGYKRNTVGEDMELVVRLHCLIKERGLKKKIVYVPDPVCWTEVPESFSVLRSQRRRWHKGLFESLWSHRKVTFNPKYGAIGFVSFPYFWIVEFFGPIVELSGYLFILFALFTGGVYIEFAILLFLLSALYGSVFSMASVLLEEWSLRKYPKVSDIVKLFLFAVTETLWYRPLTVLWRCEGIWQIIRRDHSWGEMKRKGVSK